MKTETPLTKEHFERVLDQKLDQKLSRFVTKDHFDKTLSNFVTKDFFTKEIRNLRGALHESLVVTLDNMKEYYNEETERYIGALYEDAKEKTQATTENITILNERYLDHESRIKMLEGAPA
jgi:hypothetical protein